MAFLWATSGGSALGAAAGAAGSGPGYVTPTGFFSVVNDAVPLGGNAFTTNFFGELYTPLEPIAPTTDMRWINGLFRMPGAGNVTCPWHHWASAAFQSYALVYNPWLTSLYLQTFTRPAVMGPILQGPFVENCAGYRPFSWGVNANPASPGYRDATFILWDRMPPTVFSLFNPGVGYNPPPLPSPNHQLAIFNTSYQRNLILTDDADDGSGRFVGAIDVRNYPMASVVPTGDSLLGPQNFSGWDGVAPQPASFQWWDEVPIWTPAGWPNGDLNTLPGAGPTHSTFPAAVPPGGTEVAALVFHDHRGADGVLNRFSIFTSEGNATKFAGVLNRTSQRLTPDMWNIRDPGFGNPWNDAIFNTIAAGCVDVNGVDHHQVHLEVVYGPPFVPAGFPRSHVPMTV